MLPGMIHNSNSVSHINNIKFSDYGVKILLWMSKYIFYYNNDNLKNVEKNSSLNRLDPRVKVTF